MKPAPPVPPAEVHEGLAALDVIEPAAWSTALGAGLWDLTELLSRVCTVPTALTPLRPPAGGSPARWADRDAADWRSLPDLGAADSVALEMAEQFAVDVASTGDELRRRFLGLRDDALTVAGLIFVMDFVPRTRAALRAVVPELAAQGTPPAAPAAGATGSDTPGLWEALVAFTRTVPRLDGLDAVTTELIRLRGARQHRCRLCQSLRSRPALLAGADETTFAAVDHVDSSDLPPAQRAAVAFTDAMIWTPGAIDPSVKDIVIELFTPDQRVEIVLDVTRNALNKVAVAMGADAPHVEEGTEIYDLDAHGDPVYGLSLV